MAAPSFDCGSMSASLHEMDKAVILMSLLMNLLRVEEGGGKCRIVIEYDPDTGLMQAKREEITTAESP